MIGFALEAAENLLESAQKKLESKQLDAIVANNLDTMNSDQIQATVILKDGNIIKPNDGNNDNGLKLSKSDLARWLLSEVKAIQ